MRPTPQTRRVREAEAGRAADVHVTEHPAPPAEGKWRGVLGRVRELMARRRAERPRQ